MQDLHSGTITRAYCRARKCTPFGGWRHHLPPGGGTLKLRYAVEPFMKRVFRGVLFCPRLRGKSGAAWIGGGERSEPISRMLIKPYDTVR